MADPLAIIPLFNTIKYLWSTPSWQGPLEVSGPTPPLTLRLNQAAWSLSWVRFEVLQGWRSHHLPGPVCHHPTQRISVFIPD